MIIGHGNNIHQYKQIKADFSSNVAYNNHSFEIVEYLKKQMSVINNYPDPQCLKLSEKIAQRHGVSIENVLVTNGSTEAFYLIAHLFANKKATIAYPAFAEYEDACRLYTNAINFVDIANIFNISYDETDVLWWGNPNNPDGFIYKGGKIEKISSLFENKFFVVDTAYAELSPSCEDITELHKTCENLITVHSLTKAFAIPGLRLGYIIASKDIIQKIAEISIPWSVNALAQEAGEFILDNFNHLMPDVERLCSEANKLQSQIMQIPQLYVTPSKCNYFLVKTNYSSAQELKEYLIENWGILIRNASNFRGLTTQHFRISTQTEQKNNLLLDALKAFFAK